MAYERRNMAVQTARKVGHDYQKINAHSQICTCCIRTCKFTDSLRAVHTQIIIAGTSQCILQVYMEGPSLLAADSEEEPSSDEGSDVEDNRPSLLPLDVSWHCCGPTYRREILHCTLSGCKSPPNITYN